MGGQEIHTCCTHLRHFKYISNSFLTLIPKGLATELTLTCRFGNVTSVRCKGHAQALFAKTGLQYLQVLTSGDRIVLVRRIWLGTLRVTN